jgi:hypothetical protein
VYSTLDELTGREEEELLGREELLGGGLLDCHQ